MNLISLFSSGFYVVTLFCPVPCLSPSGGSTGRGERTNLTGFGRKVLIGHSRFFFTTIPHPEYLPHLSRIPFSFPVMLPCQDSGESRFPRGGQIRVPSRNFEFPESHYVFRQNPESREYPLRHSLLRSRY